MDEKRMGPSCHIIGRHSPAQECRNFRLADASFYRSFALRLYTGISAFSGPCSSKEDVDIFWEMLLREMSEEERTGEIQEGMRNYSKRFRTGEVTSATVEKKKNT